MQTFAHSTKRPPHDPLYHAGLPSRGRAPALLPRASLGSGREGAGGPIIAGAEKRDCEEGTPESETLTQQRKSAMTQHGSNLPAGVFAEVERLEGERRDLDNTLRERVQSLIDTARREGFDVGYRAGKEVHIHTKPHECCK